jgi:hypothetical protein
LLLPHRGVEREEDCGRPVDREARADRVERNLIEEYLHVKDGVDSNTSLAYVADYTAVVELPGAPADQVAWALRFRGITSEAVRVLQVGVLR